MRRISANYIFPVSSLPIKNGIIEFDEQGVIRNIIDTKGELSESRNLEFYNGIIVPGFINTHCHLELSYLKDEISPKSGLPKFLKAIVNDRRKGKHNNIIESASKFDKLMKQKGIVAVGDISNTNETISVKKNSQIYYHTFVELIGLGNNANEIFEKQQQLVSEYYKNGLKASMVPHAPYSVSKELFLRIKEVSEASGSVLSIHNQESIEENEMFESKSGGIVETFDNLGIDLSHWNPTGKKSVASIIDWLPKENNILFVHNTYSTKEDVKLVHSHIPDAYWCLCPLSNLYIENKLPDFSIFRHFEDNVTIGTDSLASNSVLSVLEEMKVIVDNNEDVEFNKILKWSTLNGARALKIDNKFGSFEIGKSPGINLITNFDFQKMKITKKSEVKVLA